MVFETRKNKFRLILNKQIEYKTHGLKTWVKNICQLGRSINLSLKWLII